jgi:hypothetical protein
MYYCKDCWNFDRCNAHGRTVDFAVDDGVCRELDLCKPMTNADRIRAMSDEELAKWLLDMMSHKVVCFDEGAFPYTPCRNEEHDCVKCGIEWLKQPAE